MVPFIVTAHGTEPKRSLSERVSHRNESCFNPLLEQEVGRFFSSVYCYLLHQSVPHWRLQAVVFVSCLLLEVRNGCAEFYTQKTA